MFYQEFHPHPSLTPFIHCYWVLEYSASTEDTEIIIPDGQTEIILNYGNPFAEIDHLHEIPQKSFFVCGQIDRALKLKPSSQVGVVGIRFKSVGLYPLIGIPLKELNNQRVDISELLDPDQGFLERFHVCDNHETRISIVDHYLHRLLIGKVVDPAVDYFAELLQNNSGQKSLDHGYDQMGFSERHMRRKFQLWTGWSPQKMNTILRLQKALKLWKSRKFNQLTPLALEAGYYDQSHFIGDFKYIVGELPSSYFAKGSDFSENFY